ncbi:Flagellin [compost metagenome]
MTQNRSATVSDLQAAGGTSAGNDWTVTTKHAAATADQTFGKLENGNTVTMTSGGVSTTYTYDAANKNFTFTDKSASDAAALTTLANNLRPATGTTTGTYANTGSATTSFEVDATGKVTVGGQTAYLDAAGNLTTNSAGATTAATMNNLLTNAASAAAGTASISIGGKTYSSTGTASSVTFTNTITSDALLANVKASGTAVIVKLGQGITSANVSLTSGKSTDTYVDDKGTFNTTPTYTTVYTVDPNTGKATVKSGTGTGDYAPKVGAEAKVNSSGRLTTEDTSNGTKTTDPMKTLDAAFTKLDKLTGELGAVQNRLESTIANLNNVVNNLSNARSRIQDADYATEVSNMSKAQILQQAGTSVLAQANQVPQTVLSLLR